MNFQTDESSGLSSRLALIRASTARSLSTLMECLRFGRDFQQKSQLRSLSNLSMMPKQTQMKLLEQLVGALGDNLTSSETFWMTAILVDWMFWIEEGHKSCLIASGKAYSNTLALLTPDDYLFCYTADLELSRRGQRMKHEALAEQSA